MLISCLQRAVKDDTKKGGSSAASSAAATASGSKRGTDGGQRSKKVQRELLEDKSASKRSKVGAKQQQAAGGREPGGSGEASSAKGGKRLGTPARAEAAEGPPQAQAEKRCAGYAHGCALHWCATRRARACEGCLGWVEACVFLHVCMHTSLILSSFGIWSMLAHVHGWVGGWERVLLH